ncbi:cellulase [Luteimonas sp. BDR2-5]|uniref:cellulose synthase complex periplasmic endoglucanase BcsZ n=1 Tax=Proluteimonas luteida TaxID=2878685 RepID=UPI001E294444|nr:cellulose synthase complex periplasmic endoglucanase BcsZ [Luteimonas sp. BDR2-5]MCD9027073.1 cellulase [Luteimonas sp. BDR2-5]
MARPRHDPQRRRALRTLTASVLATLVLPACAEDDTCSRWPEWEAFAGRHIEADGRVVDFFNEDLRSTSESQSYALFFALVDNDQPLFERILAWTRRHLSRGRPDLHLPAWLWGRAEDGSWRILDENTASDGELWIAYALIEAGRLWRRPGFVDAGRQILALIRRLAVVDLPGFGLMLLPGVQGFVLPDRWVLNPSYLPLFVFRRFAAVDPGGPWRQLADNSVALIAGSAPAGFAPDWVAWNGQSFVTEPTKGATGSYDAIRVYLWAGMTSPRDPLHKRLLAAIPGPARLIAAQGAFAEKIDTRQGVASGPAPAGFAAALVPYLVASGEPALARRQAALIPTGPAADALHYYDRCLVLAGKGWMDRRYRFSEDGRLQPAWSPKCSENR